MEGSEWVAKAHVSKRLEILKVRWAGIKNLQISKEHFGAGLSAFACQLD